MSDTELENTQLDNAELDNAELENTQLENAQLENTELENAQLENAELENAELENAQLENAQLENAQLENAQLENAELENAELENAELENAELENAQLENAELENAQLENTEFGYEDIYKEDDTNFQNIIIEENPAAEVMEEPAAEVMEEPAAEVMEEPAAEVIEEPAAESSSIPKIVFIVPYRDREQQYRFFKTHMKHILEDVPNSKILYIHQCDNRSFNRGAMKNIGFLYIRKDYPEHYKNITFVFNDIDTMPYNKNFLNYDTQIGVIKHFYGFHFALGGIVSIKGEDFEKMNGFPNYWAWGYEDNLLNSRAKIMNIPIDRSQFYPMMDKNILQLKDGLERLVNKGEYDRFINDLDYQNMNEGLQNVVNITTSFIEETGFLNVHEFTTGIEENPTLTRVHDMRSGPIPFFRNGQQKRKGRMGMIF